MLDPLQLLWHTPLASFLANFQGLDPFLMVWTIFFGEIVMVYGLSYH